jgi:hypothetical protein
MTKAPRRKSALMPDEWWDAETEFYANERGVDPDTARTFVILRWMGQGNFKPLIAAIDAGHKLDKAVLNALAFMLEGDIPARMQPMFPAHLQLKLHRRGPARRPENFMRNLAAARAYEAKDGKSDEAFADVAEVYGTSEQTIRQAVTASRKSRKSDK